MPTPPAVIIPVQVSPVGDVYNIGHDFNAPGGLPFMGTALALPNGLWNVLQSASTHKYVVVQSTDGGTTWNPIDIANGPISGGSFGSGFLWRGNSLQVMSVNGSNQIRLVIFDTTTGLWQSPSLIPSTITTSHFFAFFNRPSKRVLFYYDDATSQMAITFLQGVTWAAPVFPSSMLPVGYDNIQQMGVTQDPVTGDMYMVGPILNTGSGTYDRIFVLQVHDDLTFGLSNALVPPSTLAINLWEAPIIGADGDSLEWGARPSGGGPAILRGAPLSGIDVSGNWTVTGNLDPPNSGFYPQIRLLNGLHVIAYILPAFPNFPRLGFEQTDGSYIWQSLPPVTGVDDMNVININPTGNPNELSVLYGHDFEGVVTGATFVLSPDPPVSGPVKLIYLDAQQAPTIVLPNPAIVCSSHRF